MSAKPNLRELALGMDQLSWAEVKSMAVQLDMGFATLKRIEERNQEISDRINSTMETWLETDSKASWKKIVTALNAIHKNVLAKDIEKKYVKATSRLEDSEPLATSSPASPEANKVLEVDRDLVYVLDVLNDLNKEEIKCLGLRLGLTFGTVENTDSKPTKSYLQDIMTAWMKKKDYVLDKGEPTKENLRKALEKEGQSGIAQKL